MTENRLTGETSPYLLQHKENPVHWQPWGTDALTLARNQGKPILLSIGYAACHWCHVMAHESFENSAVAAVMNEHFINIKVDREERPDIDAIYQSALSIMGERGGWPLTMFLTPDGEPFWGGTYFPSTARYGRPAFPDLLRGITDTFRNRRDSIDSNVTTMRNGLSKVFRPESGGELRLQTLDQIATKLCRSLDPIHGGTLGAPKFPQPSIFQFLWRAYKRTRSPMIRDAVRITLDNMCQGGIYDHLGGGFARYATDDIWLVPHFEKMLYDNALLIELLTEVWLETGAALYETRLRETIAWALREMRSDGNADYAFVSAFDADSEGVEGKFYVWREDEIDAALGTDAATFKTAYNVTSQGNWDGNNILNRSHDLELGPPDEEQRLRDACRILFDIRARRIPPQRDDKVLADWNGLMIAALARAATAFNEPLWLVAAETAFRFVTTEMTANGRLLHSWCRGRASHPAVIEDYANMSRAALVLHEATGDPAYHDQARTWIGVASEHYWDDANGGYFMNADDTNDVIARPKGVFDNATPPGNGTIVDVLARLYLLEGDNVYRQRAEDLLKAVTAKDVQALVHQPTLLNGFEILVAPLQIVIVGDTGGGEGAAMCRAAFEAPVPVRLVMKVPADAVLPEGHPARGKSLVGGRATTYICLGTTCGPPLTDADSLRSQLQAL